MAQRVRTSSKRAQSTQMLARRACLRCDRLFQSEGPHHRLCQTCREYLAESPTPEEEYSLGIR